MKGNWNTVIEGDKVLLVPYRREHVALYHEWMKDEELLAATESEPLSLDEEYRMQEDWRQDDTKCTFILLDKERQDTPGTGTHGGGMAGDVNMFWNDHDDERMVEIEVMVAEKESRRKGIAQEAVELCMAYGVHHLNVRGFRAKILFTNIPSQRLFVDKLGYIETKRVEVFQEVVLELTPRLNPSMWRRVVSRGAALHLSTYSTG